MRSAAAVVLVALAALALGACATGSESCAEYRGAARAARVPAGQTWLVGVHGGERRSSLYAMTARGLFVSRTKGRTWRRLGAGGRFLGFDASRPEHLLGRSAHGRTVLSFDGGRSWRGVRLPGCVGGLDGAVFSRAGTLVYGWAGGPLTEDDPWEAAVLVSRDGGRSFQKVAAYDAEAIAVGGDPRSVYVTTANGLFVSRTAGDRWSRASLPDDLHTVAVARSAAGTLFVAANTGRFVGSDAGEGGTTQRLYRSRDGGEHAMSVLELFDITSIDVGAGRRARVYVAGEQIADNRARVVVLRSDDLGRHWETRSSRPSGGPPTVAEMGRLASPNADRVAVDPADPEILYRDTGQRVERSTNGGRSFSSLRVRAG
jgi:hypothetical protein